MTPGKRHRLPVREGTHYKIMGSTEWAGYMYPTVVRWYLGEKTVIDSFENLNSSKENQVFALWAERQDQ
jgi:hypothetical protein